MDKFFSFFGKFAIILLIVGLLVGGGYYLGTGKLPFPSNPAPAAVTTTAPIYGTTTIPTPTVAMQHISVTGVTGTSFGGFTISVPPSWTVKKEETPGISEKLTLSNDGYSMSIYQAATGGGGCLYPGDPPAEMASTFGPFVTIHDAKGNEYRRATPAGSTGFTVCQKGESGFGLPTRYGHIGYSTPANADQSVILEMDAIFSTLEPI